MVEVIAYINLPSHPVAGPGPARERPRATTLAIMKGFPRLTYSSSLDRWLLAS